MTMGAARSSFFHGAFLLRSAGLFLFWLILTSADAGAVAPGLIAALVAGRVSIGLIPANTLAFSLIAAAPLFLRFLWQSVVAGTYVAWRALDPRMSISPGMIVYRPRLKEGPARDAFSTWSSLLPGMLPSGPDGSGGIFIHCLDAQAPVSAKLAEEEQRFANALMVRA